MSNTLGNAMGRLGRAKLHRSLCRWFLVGSLPPLYCQADSLRHFSRLLLLVLLLNPLPSENVANTACSARRYSIGNQHRCAEISACILRLRGSGNNFDHDDIDELSDNLEGLKLYVQEQRNSPDANELINDSCESEAEALIESEAANEDEYCYKMKQRVDQLLRYHGPTAVSEEDARKIASMMLEAIEEERELKNQSKFNTLKSGSPPVVTPAWELFLLKIFGDDIHAMCNLAYSVYKQEMDVEKAIQYLGIVLRMDPNEKSKEYYMLEQNERPTREELIERGLEVRDLDELYKNFSEYLRSDELKEIVETSNIQMTYQEVIECLNVSRERVHHVFDEDADEIYKPVSHPAGPDGRTSYSRAFSYLGEIYLDYYDQAPKAESLFQMALSYDPSNVHALYMLATAIWKAATLIGENESMVMPDGQICARDVYIERAAHLFQEAAKLAPDDVVLRSHIARFLVKEFVDVEQAKDLLEVALAVDPNEPDVYHASAVLLHEVSVLHAQAGNMEESVDCELEMEKAWKCALALHPAHPYAVHDYGNFLQKTLRFNEAETLFKNSLVLHPKRPKLLWQYAFMLQCFRSDDLAALEYFSRALESDPLHLPSIISIAQIHHSIGRNVELAEKYYQEALKFDPSNVEVLCNSGLLLFEAFDQADLAIDHFERALRTNPSHVPTLCNFGMLLMTREDKPSLERAEALLSLAVSLAPDHSDSARNLAILKSFNLLNRSFPLAICPQRESAEDNFEQLLQIRPEFQMATSLNTFIEVIQDKDPWRLERMMINNSHVYEMQIKADSILGDLKSYVTSRIDFIHELLSGEERLDMKLLLLTCIASLERNLDSHFMPLSESKVSEGSSSSFKESQLAPWKELLQLLGSLNQDLQKACRERISDALCALGQLFFEEGHPKSHQLFLKAIELDPQNAVAFNNLAVNLEHNCRISPCSTKHLMSPFRSDYSKNASLHFISQTAIWKECGQGCDWIFFANNTLQSSIPEGNWIGRNHIRDIPTEVDHVDISFLENTTSLLIEIGAIQDEETDVVNAFLQSLRLSPNEATVLANLGGFLQDCILAQSLSQQLSNMKSLQSDHTNYLDVVNVCERCGETSVRKSSTTATQPCWSEHQPSIVHVLCGGKIE
eukprot:767689-Hanusia_phi.AAC.7